MQQLSLVPLEHPLSGPSQELAPWHRSTGVETVGSEEARVGSERDSHSNLYKINWGKQ
jgi:hypothetical protein